MRPHFCYFSYSKTPWIERQWGLWPTKWATTARRGPVFIFCDVFCLGEKFDRMVWKGYRNSDILLQVPSTHLFSCILSCLWVFFLFQFFCVFFSLLFISLASQYVFLSVNLSESHADISVFLVRYLSIYLSLNSTCSILYVFFLESFFFWS